MIPGLTIEVDALGLLCPLPILRAQAALARRSAEGSAGGRVHELVLWADDEGIVDDLPRWCEGQGHELLELVRCTHPSGRKAWRGRIRA